jgi:hypothetical protein
MTVASWVPESQRDTRWHIWNDLYMCRVPFIHTMSSDYVRNFGMPVTGLDEYDRGMANELVVRMLSINDMVDYFGRGVTVRVCSPPDTKAIYDSISAHLNAWRRQLEDGFHVRNAPLQELQLMDRFASAVYEHAQCYFDTAFVDSLLARQMAGLMGGITRDSLITKKPAHLTNHDADETQPSVNRPSRVSMAEIFASRQIAGKAKWK